MNKYIVSLTQEELETLSLLLQEMETYSYEGSLLKGVVKQIIAGSNNE